MKGLERMYLYMERDLSLQVKKCRLPKNYVLRTYIRDDELNWENVQHKVFERDNWKKFNEEYKEDRYFNFDPNGFFFVEKNRKVVGIGAGIVRHSKKGKKYGYLDWIGILPKYRNQGLGKLLSSKILRYLKKKGLKYAFLTTPYINRDVAISLYIRMGFRIIYCGNIESLRLFQENRVNSR